MTVTLGMLMVLGLPSGAHADQITFGASSQTISFTGNGSGSVTVSITALSGNAFFDSDPLGTYAFGPATFTAGPGPTIYNAGANSQSFTFIGGDGDTLIGNVHWNFLQDSTPNPKFFGVLTITSKVGDAAFVNNWGPTANIDFITNTLSGATSFDVLSLTQNTATATISSGEVVPTPEPSTTALLAGGLLLVVIAGRVQQWSKGDRSMYRNL